MKRVAKNAERAEVAKDIKAVAIAAAGKAAAEVKEAPKAAARAVKAVGKTVEDVAEKTEQIRAEAKKTASKKADGKTEKAAKAPARKAALKETVYLQYLGKEVNKDDVMKRVREIWMKQMKRKAGDMRSVSLYLKPEENMVYYVINDEVTGSIEI